MAVARGCLEPAQSRYPILQRADARLVEHSQVVLGLNIGAARRLFASFKHLRTLGAAHVAVHASALRDTDLSDSGWVALFCIRPQLDARGRRALCHIVDCLLEYRVRSPTPGQRQCKLSKNEYSANLNE